MDESRMKVRATVDTAAKQVRVHVDGIDELYERELFDSLGVILRLNWSPAGRCLIGPWSSQVEGILFLTYGAVINYETEL